MIKGKEILGRNIVAIQSGARLAKVHDLIFDYDANLLVALLVDEGGWFRAAKVVPYGAVRSLGEDAVMVDSEEAVISAHDDARIDALLSRKQKNLVGLKLLTTDGRDLGRITDVYVEELSGQVLGYEATGGLFADLTSGRTFVPAPQSIQVGGDAAIVPLSVAAAMEQSAPGGLQGALQRASDSVSGVVSGAAGSVQRSYDGAAQSVRGGVQSVREQVRAAYQGAAQDLREGYQSLSQNVQGELADLQRAGRERQVEYALGKPAGHEILTPSGQVIVRAGEVISPLHVDQADRSGVLPQLVASASAGQVGRSAQQLGEQARAFLSPEEAPQRIAIAQPAPSAEQDPSLERLGEQLSDGVSEVKSGATEFLGRAKQWLGDKVSEAEEAVAATDQDEEQRRIREVLGRPVNRVILDPQDHVILNVGEVITNRAIQEARRAGVLDILLSSVGNA